MNKPDTTPDCCGTPAKWVEQTPSLAYFYCSTCKTEPKPSVYTGYSGWSGLGADYSKYVKEQNALLKNPVYADPLPTGIKIRPGDMVKWSRDGLFYVVDEVGNYIATMALFGGGGLAIAVPLDELTLVP